MIQEDYDLMRETIQCFVDAFRIHRWSHPDSPMTMSLEKTYEMALKVLFIVQTTDEVKDEINSINK